MYWLFALSAFLAATLVFSIQPMVGKMLLPTVGGTSGVWNTTMVFFQAVLLLGYLYAHLSTRWLGPARQWKLHLVLVIAGLLFLPISFTGAGDSALLNAAPATWVLLTLVTAAFWPVLMVSSTAPLLQRWLAATDHSAAPDPYPLYAASNGGSILALLAYPFLVEPWLGLTGQSYLWFGGYGALLLSLLGCARSLHRHSGPRIPDFGAAGGSGVHWKRRAKWFLWAFIPSSLLLSVTSLITTDLAPMPLLWVVPLSIYLLSHVHAFARRRLLTSSALLPAAPLVIASAAITLALDLFEPLALLLTLHLAVFLTLALLFHGLLADSRPPPADLTGFYLWLAVGGLAGGVFNGLLAPVLFNHLLEYPGVLALALFALPSRAWRNRPLKWSFHTALGAVAVLLAWAVWNAGSAADFAAMWAAGALAALTALATLAGKEKAARTTAIAAAVTVLSAVWWSDAGEMLSRRSYYGIHKVFLGTGGEYNVLTHGNTIHGVQRQTPGYRDVPLTYYHPDGPLGDIFAVANGREFGGDVAIIGLGAGSIATYRRPGQRMVFYEIDPEVTAIARNPRLFTYLDACGPACVVKEGDGRRRLAGERDRRFQIIVVDAYSSGSIPLHLLTDEAMKIFLRRLKPDGVIAMHVSNTHADLAPIVARVGKANGLSALRGRGGATSETWVTESEWVVLTRNRSLLERMQGPAGTGGGVAWGPISLAGGQLWTDDFTPIWRAYTTR